MANRTWRNGVLCTGTVIVLTAHGCSGPTSRVRPNEYETFIRASGLTDEFRVTVDLEQAPPSVEPLDILIVYDATGSMREVIDVVRTSALEILDSISAVSRNTRIAVGSLADYHNPGGPWMLHLDFTHDLATAQNALEAIALRPGSNNDIPEAYSRALHEAHEIAWRAEAQRFLLIFGDAPAHDPAFYGSDLGVDPGRDGASGTADDLRLTEVVDALAASNIRVLTVFDESKRGGLLSEPSPYFDEAVAGFEYMARQTRGMFRPVSAAREIPTAIEAALQETFRLRPKLEAPPHWAQWVLTSEAQATDVETVFDFDVVLQPPPDAEIGIYRFPLVASHAGDIGGEEIGFTGITIRLGWLYYPWRPILVLFYLLGLPLAFFAWSVRQRNIGRSIPYYGHWSFIRLGWHIAALGLVIIGLYLVWSTAPGSLPPFTR